MITKLYYFTKVAQTGNLTKAAEALFISQPALTMAIKRLEKDLDVTLFNREGNRLTLSPAGEKILPYAEAVYSDYINLKTTLNRYKSASHSVKLGSGISHAAEICEHYMEKVYDGSLVLQQYFDYYNLRSALFEKTIDIAFCTPPIIGPDIISRDLFVEPICALMNASHPLAAHDVLDIQNLVSYPLITLPKNFPMRVAIDRAFDEINTKVQYSIEVDSIVMASMLKREDSKLVTLYPLSRARTMYNLGGLEYRPINSKSFKRTLSFSWTSSCSYLSMLDDILKFTEEYYHSSPNFQKWGHFLQEQKIVFDFEALLENG